MIIIPTIHARPDLLDACLQAIERTVPESVPVIIADGASFAENCNAGAAHAKTDILVFLNDDCEPHGDWYRHLTAPLTNPHVGATGCRLIYPSGDIQHAGVEIDTRDGYLSGYNVLTDEPSRNVDAVTAACMAIRRETFEHIGGFDAAYVNGNEDVDLCLRLRAEGYKVRYVAEATVTHHESSSGAARWTHVRENVERLQQWMTGNSSPLSANSTS